MYKGIDQTTGGVVAIKEVSLEGASADDLQSEIDLLKNLHHRNVVQYLGTFKVRPARPPALARACAPGWRRRLCTLGTPCACSRRLAFAR